MSGNGEQKPLLYYIHIDRQEKDRLIDVNALQGAAGKFSDHQLVIGKLKERCGCVKRISKESG